jgi:type I restriction enzyme S subunit
MKAGWKIRRLEEVCEEITDGSHFSPKTTDDGYPYVTVRDIENDEIDFTNCKFISAADYHQLLKNGCRPRQGDVLFSKDGTIGKVALIDYDEEFVVLSSLAIVRPDVERIKPSFLKWVMKSPAFFNEAVGKKTGVALRRIILLNLKSMPVPVPPLAEQQRIVAILDEAFAGIATAKANAEKNLQNARAIFKSHLQSVFIQPGPGWVETTIGQVIRFIDYRGKTPAKTASGLRLITAKNVKMGYLQETPREFVAPKSYSAWMTRGIPRRGDVLFTTEAPLANVAQLDTDEKVVFAQRIIIMQPDAAKLDGTFLKYLLLSQPVQQRIRAKGTGATVQGIKASLLKTIEIPFPKSLTEQEQIVEKLDVLSIETQRLESLYRRKLVELEALKKSLLHQAFTGELTAQPEEYLREAAVA